MYETSTGDRAICGAEQKLFVELLHVIILMLEDEEAEFGIASFDATSRGSRVSAVLDATYGLFSQQGPAMRRAAYIDAAIAAVLECALMLIREELDDSRDGRVRQYWRRLTRDAARQFGLDVPETSSENLEEWRRVKDQLLWRWAHESFASELYFDVPPVIASVMKKTLCLPDDYFVRIPEDPHAEETSSYTAAIRQFAILRRTSPTNSADTTVNKISPN